MADILPYLGVGVEYTDENAASVNMTMPSVTDMTEEEAAAELKDNNLTYIVVGDGSRVTDQIPAAGGWCRAAPRSFSIWARKSRRIW